MLMVMALVPMYLLPIVIYDGLKQPILTVKWFSWGAVIVLFLTMFNFTIISNISYFNMALKYEKSYAFVNRMIDRVEQIDGYENVVKFAVIGRPLMRSECRPP